MKSVLIAAAIALVAGLASHPVFAGGFDREVKARKALMQVYAFNISILGAMAKGKRPYEAKLAQAAADNLLAAVSMKNAVMWPKGADNDALGDKTRAKPKLWSTYPKVAEKSKRMQAVAKKMAAAAGKGLDAVKANMKALGSGCGGCHKPFRAPKK